MQHIQQTVFVSESGDRDAQNDRRKFLRFKSNKQAVIHLWDSHLCDCIIKDISQSGARLLVTDRNWIPRQFDVIVGHQEALLSVKRIWQAGDSVGVEISAQERENVWTVDKLRELLEG